MPGKKLTLTAAETRKVLTQGHYQSSRFFVIRWLNNHRPGVIQLTGFVVIVSKKYDNRAVHRNRVKRAITAWLRKYRGFLKTSALTVSLRPPAKSLANQNITGELKKIFIAAGLLEQRNVKNNPKFN